MWSTQLRLCYNIRVASIGNYQYVGTCTTVTSEPLAMTFMSWFIPTPAGSLDWLCVQPNRNLGMHFGDNHGERLIYPLYNMQGKYHKM